MIEAAPPAAHPSLLTWTITSLGPIYLILLLLAGLVSFMLALAILVRGRGPFAAAALVLVVPAPMLIGLFAAVDGIMRSFTVIAMSTSTPKPSEMAAGVSTAIVASLFGMLMMAPGYGVAVVGALVRSFIDRPKSSPPSN